ncbi:ATP-binding cassette domain-containing protein [Chloroflexota bacterium]
MSLPLCLPGELSRVEMNFRVVSVKNEGHLKRIRLESPGPSLLVPLSASARKGDLVLLRNGEAWVRCANGLSQFMPVFVAREKLALGDLKIDLLIKEITEKEEYESVQSLAEYHYRGSRIHGRTATLIARNSDPRYPKVLGYIELATPFYMNKARAKILNAPFSSDGISWECWDKETTRKCINLMVRVARSVVYPEFRGLGLGQILLRYAIEFAKTRWHISNYVPIFIEISADMLKFVPFAEKAGMIFIGETEGNLGRVYKDMEYLTRNAERVKRREIVLEKSCGIVDQQVARMNRTLSLIEQRGQNRDDILARLKNLSRSEVLRDFALFHGIVTLPKPTYMKGLNPAAEQFLLDRVEMIKPRNGQEIKPIELEPLKEPIKLLDVTLSFNSKVRRTKSTHSIQQAFGISPDSIESIVLRRLSVDVQPGEIVLIIGPSGSGKTTLIDFLFAGKEGWGRGQTDGSVSWPINYAPGIFRQPKSHKALVELMPKRDVSSALYLMGLVGLSDAFVYLKRFEELSKGQQYRAMLARMIANGYNVWLIDEFCANLDRVTANVVADKLQSLARSLGATVIAASPHCDTFVSTFKPDKIVRLTTASEHHILRGDDFVRTISPEHLRRSRILSLRLKPDLLEAVRCGRKTSTIRAGRKNIEQGLLVLESAQASLLVRITQVTYKCFKSLKDEDARKEGYICVGQLEKELRSIYPTLGNNSFLTQVEFELVTGDGISVCAPSVLDDLELINPTAVDGSFQSQGTSIDLNRESSLHIIAKSSGASQ